MKKLDLREDERVKQCVKLIAAAKSIGVLSGAGISTNAGIPDFRGPQGLYVTKKYDPDKVFDIRAFYQDPNPFYEFAKDFIELERTIKPTFTHQYLAKLELKGKLQGIITQNIDSLHQIAGSRNVFEIHGSFWQSHCLDCNKAYTFKEIKRKLLEKKIPKCSCGGVLKPDIVFFGENVKNLEKACDLAAQVDLFFVLGTSCVVYPAAMIPNYSNGKIIVVNRSETALNLPNIVLQVNEDTDEFFRKVSAYEI